MSVKISTIRPKTHLVAMIFGPPGSAVQDLALSFPKSVVVDAYGTIEGEGDARLLRTAQPGPIIALIGGIGTGKVEADTFVIHGLSRIQDEIQAGAPEASNRYYAAVRKRVSDVVDAARSLHCNVVFTVRSKDSYANTGDIVRGYTVGPEDKVIVGVEPDIDRAIPYDVDLVLEIRTNEEGGIQAFVASSHLAGIKEGSVIDEPTAEKILTLSNLPASPARPVPPVVETKHAAADQKVPPTADKKQPEQNAPAAEKPASNAETDKVADYAKIEADHPHYGSNEHLKALAAKLNERLPNGSEPLKASDYLIKIWKMWDGKGNLPQEIRVAAVLRFLAELAKPATDETPPPADETPARAERTNEAPETVKLDATKRNRIIRWAASIGFDIADFLRSATDNAVSSLADAKLTRIVYDALIDTMKNVAAEKAELDGGGGEIPGRKGEDSAPAGGDDDDPSPSNDSAPNEPAVEEQEPPAAQEPEETLTPQQQKLVDGAEKDLASLPVKAREQIVRELLAKREGGPKIRWADVSFVQMRISAALKAIKKIRAERAAQAAA